MKALVDEFVPVEGEHRAIGVRAYDDWPKVELSIYGSAGSHWIGWWRRIRIAWEVIIYGRAILDIVCLRPGCAGTLAAWLHRAAELAADAAEKEDK